MPTYDYKCLDCNYAFEEFQKMTDEPLQSCPSCSGNLKRLIGAGGAPIFKGSGFYQTDYKSSSASNKSTNTKSNDSTTPKSPKPETKSKTKDPKN